MDMVWYETLRKPVFTPSASWFGPIWIILYFLIIVSGVIFFLKKTKVKKGKALKFYFGQWILNLTWSPVFFGLHQIGLACVIIIFMWILIYKTIKEFGKIDKTAAYLLYPYLFWVTCAGILNLSVMILNY